MLLLKGARLALKVEKSSVDFKVTAMSECDKSTLTELGPSTGPKQPCAVDKVLRTRGFKGLELFIVEFIVQAVCSAIPNVNLGDVCSMVGFRNKSVR